MGTMLTLQLQQLTVEVAALRTELATQLTRIGEMQAELDLLPQARKRRQMLRAVLTQHPSSNGNGRKEHQEAPLHRAVKST